ncbi:hypothetical protein CASFOL_006715 [Castilleja foliolosa]|uniref:F-box/LRR-repeat protein 15/At3g58940/PEG3-like LRR domain-containing protein n=1 Tax=Castilleja foliolosa TaxID=1961234 RepID=A0ABD3E817_9LAMI
MENRSQTQAINGDFQLPEPIIHRVQSFLTAYEAARTTILSKSWRSAWLTRPNLDLDLYFMGGDDLEYANKTIQRYEQSNLKIESLRLCIWSPLGGDFVHLANDLFTRALKIGATHLSFRHSPRKVILPQVVFEAENLVELSVHGCKIDDLESDRKVRCSKLESLNLSSVTINSEMISSIASCCPLIEKLSLCNVVPFNDDDDLDYSFSRLHSLKDLTLRGCRTQEVSSRSLERLCFATERYMSVKFDVPSIRKFRFEIEGDEIPSLFFEPASSEWESDVFIKNFRSGLSALLFRRLNKLLTELSLSRIYLYLNMGLLYLYKSCQYEMGDIRDLPKPKVESLTLDTWCLRALDYFALFHGLFQICRPKFITTIYRMRGDSIGKNNLLCKTLALGLDDKSMYDLHDLEEVNVHFFDEDVDAWQPMQLESLLDPSISIGIQKFRFQLIWKP